MITTCVGLCLIALALSTKTQAAMPPLHKAAATNNVRALKALLQNHNDDGSVDIDAPDSQENTPLHYAAWGNREILLELLNHNATVDAKNNSGNTPLHIAASHQSPNSPECIIILVKKGLAEVDAVNNNGSTPLHAAALNGHLECIQTLIMLGADRTKKNMGGKTPEEVAEQAGKHTIVDFFREIKSA